MYITLLMFMRGGTIFYRGTVTSSNKSNRASGN